ncbi:GNAT family N-acetyltransferase [Shewanella pneumatophori]|uniref:GNAT family N-acetyltransferase n=1 Tax=Shewanella pneumatophori TaxID=314092 RepID=A0A9X1ZAX8_9GAMM|nr:GNAT family N-acetyltransferase [Shewanella pneumatophori]MCL1138884.1 GNAT family N-acetyltransferase [Shewanella pneumatophori]
MTRPTLSIQEITPANLPALLNLELNTAQIGFIEPIADCLQEAKEDTRYKPVALYYGEDMAGFAMYGQFDDCEQLTPSTHLEQTKRAEASQQTRVWFDRFLIDKRFQGLGLGKGFAKLLLSDLFEHFNCQQIYLSVYPNNLSAISLYQQLGFEFTGELVCDGEQVMRCKRLQFKG